MWLQNGNIVKIKLTAMCVVLLFPVLCFAQSKNKGAEAIKVYVRDAETGKNIPDAKVTLEGYEIPAIQGSYQKAGAYYYFKQVPDGYNTVMVYHSKYNEKGFQDVKGLPKVLSLKLQDYRYVSYSFEKPVLKEIRKDYIKQSKYIEKITNRLEKYDSVVDKNFRYLYNEDPYHIAVISKYDNNTFFERPGVKDIINTLLLEQTLYKHGNEQQLYYNCYGFTLGGFYSNKYGAEEKTTYECPCKSGFETVYRVYFFHKKDQSRFSRFNCAEIKALREFGLTTAALTNRVIEYYANAPFSGASFGKFYKRNINANVNQRDIDNYEFGRLQRPEQIFFKDGVTEDRHYFGNARARMFDDISINEYICNLYFVVPKHSRSSAGLGLLDDKDNTGKAGGEMYMFNSVYGINIDKIQ